MGIGGIVLLAIGVVILAAGVLDALWTTLWVDGHAGPISSRVTTYIWKALRAAVPPERHRALSLNGPLTLALIVMMWVVMIWAGWVFIFSSDWESLRNTKTHSPPSIPGRIYFVAFTLSTMGNGDIIPQTDRWEVVTGLCCMNGMLVLTLAVSYVISVVSAVVSKRTLASGISGLGRSAEDVVLLFWDGHGFGGADEQFTAVAGDLARVTEQHLAYPILHYYHAAECPKSSAVTVALLDDALMILEHGVSPELRPTPAVLHSARSAVRTYLDTLKGAWIGPAKDLPPLPNLAKLRERGVPTVTDDEFYQAMQRESGRRRLLLGMVQNGAWQWPPVT